MSQKMFKVFSRGPLMCWIKFVVSILVFCLTQILKENEDGAADGSPNPLAADDVIGEDLVGHGSDEHDAISGRQTDQVAIGRRMHRARTVHDLSKKKTPQAAPNA